jgi:hypothetical protein
MAGKSSMCSLFFPLKPFETFTYRGFPSAIFDFRGYNNNSNNNSNDDNNDNNSNNNNN